MLTGRGQGSPGAIPGQLPEWFIRFLTDPGDVVLDIFGGSMTTGWAAERLERAWLGFELSDAYVEASRLRFYDEHDRLVADAELGTAQKVVGNGKDRVVGSGLVEERREIAPPGRSEPTMGFMGSADDAEFSGRRGGLTAEIEPLGRNALPAAFRAMAAMPPGSRSMSTSSRTSRRRRHRSTGSPRADRAGTRCRDRRYRRDPDARAICDARLPSRVVRRGLLLPDAAHRASSRFTRLRRDRLDRGCRQQLGIGETTRDSTSRSCPKSVSDQRVRGKPRSMVLLPGSGLQCRDNLGPRVELDTLRPVHAQVAEQGGLPAAETVRGDRDGDRHVDADHARLRRLPRDGRTRPSADRLRRSGLGTHL